MRWHLGQLDALRGIAILNVFLVHSVYWDSTHILNFHWQFLSKAFYAGQRGVQLFFLVSAFTLFMSNESGRPERNRTLNFFLRRFFRITPLFYLVTILTLLFRHSIVGSNSSVALSMLYLASFSPVALGHGAAGSWSIGVEFAFYACLPLFFRMIKNVKAATIAFVLAFALRLTLVALLVPSDQQSNFWHLMSLPANLPVFMLGVLLFFIWKEYLRKLEQGSERAKQLSLLALLMSVTMYIEHPPFSVTELVGGSLIYFMLMTSLLLHPWSFFVNAFTRLVGKISFSLYLLHFYIAYRLEEFVPTLQRHTLLQHEIPQAMFVFFGTFICTFPLALLTWKYIETPGIQLGRRLIAWNEGRTQPPIEPKPLEALLSPTATRDEQF